MQPFKYKPKVNSGDLRNKIDIYANTKIVNALGETSYKFEKVKSIWSSVIPQTGKLQNQQAETILTNVTHKIIVRYSAGKDITKDMKILFRGHRFEILYILNPYFKNEVIEIFCQELID
jgi:SPP1 family predicted phage head-tail adaptor